MGTPLDDFSVVVARADRRLWAAYAASLDESKREPGIHLVFPRYQRGDNPIRVSEQEARFTLANELDRNEMLFSVETPTIGTYGEGNRAAMTDMTVYDRQRMPVCNVEFKSKGYTLARGDVTKIRKDFDKLLFEPPPGFWFHLLHCINNSTLGDLITVLNAILQQVWIAERQRIAPGRREIVFHICVLYYRRAFQFKLMVDPGDASPPQLPSLIYQVQGENLAVVDSAGWTVTQ